MKKIVSSPNAPAALGPYSHAVEAGGFLFTSGQIGLDPATGKLAGETTLAVPPAPAVTVIGTPTIIL